MLLATKNRPTVQTFRTIRGVSYRVRKVETFRFAVYRVDSRWVEPRTAREETAFVRQGLPCVCVATTHETLTRNGTRSVYIVRDVRGDYANVSEYLDTVSTVGTVSHRNRSGMLCELLLTDLDQ